MLEVTKETVKNVVVLRLKGQLDAITAGHMKPTVDELMAAKTPYVVFSLADVSLIDSSGIGVIVSVFKRTRAWDGDTRIAGLTAQPYEVFKLLNLDKALSIYATEAEALNSFT